MKTYVLPLYLLAFVMLVLSGCDSNEPDEGAGEEEFITRVVLTLTPQGGGTAVTAVASDPDGDGTNIQFTTLSLRAGTTYTGALTFFDDLNDEDVTEEIEEEDDAHRVFYTPGGGVASRLAVTVTDRDENGLPVGLDFTVAVSAGAAATGTLNLQLAHYDGVDKRASDTAQNRPGTETDIDVTFPVAIAN